MKFTVKRDKWRCGDDGEHSHGKGDTQLLNKEGYLCCLGYCANQLKVPKKKLKGLDVPEQLQIKDILVTESKFDGGSYYHNSALSEVAMRINDNKNLTRQEREEKLIEAFKDSGHELVFTGKYSDEE